jgi:hypothetical protein
MSDIDESSGQAETRQNGSATRRYRDDKFRTNWVRYLSQSLMAAVSVLVVLLILDSVKQTVLLDMHEAQIIFGALATGLAMLLMVITDTEHPPAASLALGFVLNEWDALTVLAVISGIVALASIKEVLKFRLIDLL